MRKKHFIIALGLTILYGLGIIIIGCSTGVESSPDHGILRVTLQSEPADTFIVIIADTFAVSEGDSFGVTIFQGKVYHNNNTYALLYKDTDSYRTEDITYNIIRKENGEYKKFVIYESYVPPGDYNMLQIGVTASLLKIGNFYIPVKLPQGSDLLIDLFQDFQVRENRITEVNLQISPFKSVLRYRDSFHFTREIKITDIEYK